MIQAKDVTKPENISSQCPYVHHNTNVSNVGIKVVVTVKDANDNPPNFTETHLSKGILRNTKFETVILDLTVSLFRFYSNCNKRRAFVEIHVFAHLS